MDAGVEDDFLKGEFSAKEGGMEKGREVNQREREGGREGERENFFNVICMKPHGLYIPPFTCIVYPG